ncbi:MAG: zinc-dependent metalloprotease [Saprospiraceae bacterium]|nr:zinc-dependent metalloprotease [Saprospiraceae bacterium]
MKNLSRWPTDRYVNIWIVRCILPDNDCTDNGGTLGYAYLPPVSAQVDGIVVAHKFLGTTGTASGNNTNPLTHEMGHYLSLYHVWWTDGFSTCSHFCHEENECMAQGDKVCDTQRCAGPWFTSNCAPQPTDCNNVCPGSPAAADIYPKDNYMSYSHACQDRFTECQSARMKFALENYRQGLWSESNLTCTGASGFFGNDIVIQTNTNWATANLPNGGNITITGTLTIQPDPATPNIPVVLNIGAGVTVHFCESGKLVVKPNAILDLSGMLTNSCNGQWNGVEVWGDNTKSQYVQNGRRWQGRLVGRSGAVIENAKTGAQLWGPDYYANAGGQISCTGTTFRNNLRGVEFAPYENFWPFSVPAGWLNDVRDYLGSFTGCTFVTNDDYVGTQQFNAFLHMTGVRGVRVSGSSFANSRTITSSNFVDWGYGIFATDAGFNVTATPVGNTYPPSSYIASGFNNLGYGIYTANTTGNKPYSVQQANFNGCFVGLYNKGVSAGVTLFNTFNLGNVPSTTVIPITPLGSSTQQDQVGVMFENAISGFTFEENDFLKVSGNVTNTIGSICKNTGTFNNVVRKNRYTGISHGNVANDNNAVNFVAPPRGLNYLCNENTNVGTYDFLVTNGEIRSRQGIFVSFTPPNTYVYNAAGNKFSYLPGTTQSDFKNSGAGLTYYYDPNKPNQEPIDISAGITKVPVLNPNDCLSNYCKPPCKSDTELEQIKNEYYTDRSIWEGLKADYATAPTSQKAEGIAYRQSRMDAAAYMIVLHELHDTLDFSIDTLRKWVGNMHSLESDLWLASDYVRTGETNAATTLLNAAPAKYQLDSESQGALNAFKSVLDLLSGKSVYALDETTRNGLATYAASEGHAAGVAQNILTWYGTHYPPAYMLYASEERDNKPAGSTNSLERKVIVIPNPSVGPVTLRFILPNGAQGASLRVSDVNGRLVQGFDALSSNGEVSMIFATPGMYFYLLMADGRLVESGKIMIQR